MKKPNYLKGLRVVLAILIFVPILLFFVDFADVLPDNLHTLLHLQIMPAILGGMAGLVVFQFVLALLFGRIYCSVICPAGVLQDIINRVFCIGKKKKKGVRRFSYHKPMNILRYSILGLTFVLAVFGMIELCTLLDPYSNFGRIANNLFRPVVMWVNNLLADGLARMDNYTLYHVTMQRDGIRRDIRFGRVARIHPHGRIPGKVVLQYALPGRNAVEPDLPVFVFPDLL